MPRLPTMRVIGSHAISTKPVSCAASATVERTPHQVFWYPVSNSEPFVRHVGSSSTFLAVKPRRARITVPYMPLAAVDTFAPGGSSMNGMNLSGNPGIVHAMQIPPTFGHPPTPLIHPRFGTLHFTTGPQQPSLTRHFGTSYVLANSPCS